MIRVWCSKGVVGPELEYGNILGRGGEFFRVLLDMRWKMELR
jgi:hypothetical protein